MILLFDHNFAFESRHLKRYTKALKIIFRIIMEKFYHLENVTHEQRLGLLRLWERQAL